MKHRSYNPFKMWMSYVGLSLGFILGITNWLPPKFCNIININGLCSGASELMWIGNIIWGVIFSIVGFILFWGIHSLIRKLTKGKI